MSVLTLVLGRKLANCEVQGRKIGAWQGVPAMGLDGLGSASYGPEAMLTVLAVAGGAGLGAVQPLTWVILALLFLLFMSYWQTIAAYPSNGGCYTVARENLGETAGLLGAAALMIDYMLNVAVGISAGIGALTSALPALHPWTLPLCLSILAVITVVNLRGTRDSGMALAVPTYLFIASLLFVLGAGAWSAWSAGGHPQPVIPPPAVSGTAGAVTLWLLLRAFSAGCTAMTGVEAVSNGVGEFKDPAVRHAHRTLAAICAVLGTLLFGIAALAHAYGVSAMGPDRERLPERDLPARGRRVRARAGLFRHHRQRARRAVPVGQHQLRRLPSAVPGRRRRRLPAHGLRGPRPPAGLHRRRAVPQAAARAGCCSPSTASPTG